MKHTKPIVVVLSLLICIVFTLSACSSNSNFDTKASASSTASWSVAPAAPQEAAMVADRAGGLVSENVPSAPIGISDRKIVKHSYLTLETKDFDTALQQIFSAINQNGGYVENQSTNGQSLQSRAVYYERSASVSARIPADKLDIITAEIGGICNVVSQSANVDDITDSYYDTDARLKSLQMQEERLLEILSKAEKLEDVISLERALSDVRYQIESLTASIRRMDSQIAYSYLNMDLREVVEYQSIDTAPKNLGEKIAASFKRSGEKIAMFFEALLLFVIEDLPLAIIWLAILGVVAFVAVKVLWVFRRRLRRTVVNNPLDKAPSRDNPPSDK